MPGISPSLKIGFVLLIVALDSYVTANPRQQKGETSPSQGRPLSQLQPPPYQRPNSLQSSSYNPSLSGTSSSSYSGQQSPSYSGQESIQRSASLRNQNSHSPNGQQSPSPRGRSTSPSGIRSRDSVGSVSSSSFGGPPSSSSSGQHSPSLNGRNSPSPSISSSSSFNGQNSPSPSISSSGPFNGKTSPSLSSRPQSQNGHYNDDDDDNSLSGMPFADASNKELKDSALSSQRRMICKRYIKKLDCQQKGKTKVERNNFCRDKVCVNDNRKDGKCKNDGVCCCSRQHIKKKKWAMYDDDEDQEDDYEDDDPFKEAKREDNKRGFRNLPFNISEDD